MSYQGPGPDAAPVASPQFRLSSGDHLRIKVFGNDQISGEYDVDVSGSVAIPLAGTISAAGLTPVQLGDKIADQLRAQHMLTNPSVTVEVLATTPIYVLGQVEKPGEYPFRSGINVISAIATAGGFKYRADEEDVFVRHAGQSTEVKVPFSSAMPLQPGDIVRVADRML